MMINMHVAHEYVAIIRVNKLENRLIDDVTLKRGEK